MKYGKKQNRLLNEIQKKLPIHFKNKVHNTLVNRLKIGHTRLTFQCLMAGEEPFNMSNSTQCHQYENKEKIQYFWSTTRNSRTVNRSVK